MLNQELVYDIMYALAARDGREATLFGDSAPLAHEAFVRSCAGKAFPELWFELPLMGDPRFDLHVLTSRETLEPGTSFTDDETCGHPDLFSWFASAEDVRQLALSHDTSSGVASDPAVQLLVRHERMHEPFLERAGGKEAAAAYRAFAQRLPEGWFPCYTGVFPVRAASFVRVECIPNVHLQRAYASDPALLASHLRQVGVEGVANADDEIVARCHMLAGLPFQFEFQFDVTLDGSLGDTLGASTRFAAPSDDRDWKCFDAEGAAGELMLQVEKWGLADDRWRLLPDTVYAKRVAYSGKSIVAYCYPAFVKLRWRAGEPLDAKTYLIASLT